MLNSRILFASTAIFAAAAWAGEILIVQPAPTATTGDNRSETEARQLGEQARQRLSGKAAPEMNFTLDSAGNLVIPDAPTATERLRMDARGYLDSGRPKEGDAQVILRAEPLTDAERSRLKARSYVVDQPKSSNRNCSYATNDVGMIGEGAGAQKSQNVIEHGGAAVNPNCR